jgi:hypothetical protein
MRVRWTHPLPPAHPHSVLLTAGPGYVLCAAQGILQSIEIESGAVDMEYDIPDAVALGCAAGMWLVQLYGLSMEAYNIRTGHKVWNWTRFARDVKPPEGAILTHADSRVMVLCGYAGVHMVDFLPERAVPAEEARAAAMAKDGAADAPH